MHDFGEIVYLDMQKTGSTTTSRFLRKCCRLEERAFRPHGRMQKDYRPESFYFTTVRNPLDLYRSLFRYGLDEHGGLFESIRNAGHEAIYEGSAQGFANWFSFVNAPENAHLVSPVYPDFARIGLGIMTFRHLWLVLRFPRKTIGTCQSLEDLQNRYEADGIVDEVIRNEELNTELRKLAEDRFPELFHADRVRKFFTGPSIHRPSKSMARSTLDLPDAQMELLRERERFLIDRFYSEEYAQAG